MTVAAILISIFLTSSTVALPAIRQDAQQAAQPVTTNKQTNQESTPSVQTTSSESKPAPPTQGTAQVPSKQNSILGERSPHKKKASSPNCNPAPASTSPASAPSNTGSTASASETSAKADAAPANCPPSKIIVRQGGASEPAIHLAGGPGGDQAAQQRNTANQMLAATDENLKKMAGHSLTANQQDMVNQIHQFMEQSKAATKAGDLDRARTLAWKAQLLSEELVNPEKK